MKTLYLDCQMGAAGDMLTAALLELFPEPRKMVEKLNALGFSDVRYIMEPSVKCGITGTHMTVLIDGMEENTQIHEHVHDHSHGSHHDDHDHHEERGPHQDGHCHSQDDHDHSHDDHCHPHADHDHLHDHPLEDHDHLHDHHHEDHAHPHEHDHAHHAHVHHGMADIEHIVNDHLVLPESVRKDVLQVFGLIAEAESHVHGKPVTEIHFHEVGTMDAVADIAAVCFLMHELSVDDVVVSPVHTGFGQVRCAHGILPVPAPATAYLLQGIPNCSGEIEGELCTPTGAALLKYFAGRFGNMPVLQTTAIGYGMGKKDFKAANCVRAILGETIEQTDDRDMVIELSCNVDDMTAEAIGYATEKLLDVGALDVYTVPVGMKKNRPGTLICVLCRPADKNKVIEQIFRHTTTIGIRASEMNRYVLKRETRQVETSCGTVRCKVSSGYGIEREKYEYEDIARLADERGCSLQEILSAIK